MRMRLESRRVRQVSSKTSLKLSPGLGSRPNGGIRPSEILCPALFALVSGVLFRDTSRARVELDAAEVRVSNGLELRLDRGIHGVVGRVDGPRVDLAETENVAEKGERALGDGNDSFGLVCGRDFVEVLGNSSRREVPGISYGMAVSLTD
jgi:hypothetical protein